MANRRGPIYLVLAVLTGAFIIIAMTTNLGKFEATNGDTTIDPWYACVRPDNAISTCTSLTDGERDCQETIDHFSAMQAFYILAGIFTVPAIAFGVLDTMGGMPRMPLAGRIVMVILAALIAVFALVAFPLGISTQTREFCGAEEATEYDNHEWGPSAFFMMIAFVSAVIMMIVALVCPGPEVVHQTTVTTKTHVAATHPV